MRTLVNRIREEHLRWAIVLLALPALLINLGLLPLLGDEPTRALVAMELIVRDNLIVPTINGELYLNKPPVFNWLLVAIYHLGDGFTEFLLRLPSTLSYLLLTAVIYLWAQRNLSSKPIAFFAALGFLLMGRVWTYETTLGYIDSTFSLLIFLSFIATYHFYHRQEWLKLFAVTYFIAGVTFLMKGLPPVVFQGCTLLAVFVVEERRFFWKLFSWQHLAGGALFLAIVGSYYWAYGQEVDLKEAWERLWYESAHRTVAAPRPWYQTLGHLAWFPFDHLLVHMLPFGFFAAFCLHRPFLRAVRADRFLRFVAVVFLANIPVYWLSPGNQPRYILMLYPLLTILIGYGYYTYRQQFPRLRRGLEALLGFVATVAAVAALAPLFMTEQLEFVDGLALKTAAVCLALGASAMLYWLRPDLRMLALMLTLVFIRFGFDWFVIPHRYHNSRHAMYRDSGRKLAELTQGKPVSLLQSSVVNHDVSFYYSERSGRVLGKAENYRPGDYLVVNDFFLERIPNKRELYTFRIEYLDMQMHLIQALPEPEAPPGPPAK